MIDKYPVTWEQFVAMHQGHDRSCVFCLGRNKVLPSRFMSTPMKSRDRQDYTKVEERLPRLNDAISAAGGENIPVTYLPWRQMSLYARAVGAELPSEAEWEYANRAPGGEEPGAEVDRALIAGDERERAEEEIGGNGEARGNRPPNQRPLRSSLGSVAHHHPKSPSVPRPDADGARQYGATGLRS